MEKQLEGDMSLPLRAGRCPPLGEAVGRVERSLSISLCNVGLMDSNSYKESCQNVLLQSCSRDTVGEAKVSLFWVLAKKVLLVEVEGLLG